MACLAQTFGPNVKLKQTNILTITNIEVGINLSNPPCWVPKLHEEPTFALFRNGNQLELVVAATGAPFCNPLPLLDPPHQFYNIGMLEEGTYDLQVRAVFRNTLFFPFANDGTVIGHINNIHVGVATPVPSLHWFSIGLLALFVLFVVFYKFNKNSKKGLLLVVMLLFVGNVQAEKIFHNSSADEAAPTPAMVMA